MSFEQKGGVILAIISASCVIIAGFAAPGPGFMAVPAAIAAFLANDLLSSR